MKYLQLKDYLHHRNFRKKMHRKIHGLKCILEARHPKIGYLAIRMS